jgi:predicted HNH restriction endonuclease
MRDQEFEHWLKKKYPNPNTWETYRSETRRIAKHKGNLDELYERDCFAILLASFQCSQKDGVLPTDDIPHNANPYVTARFRRRCLELYVEFHKQNEKEYELVDDTFDDLPSMDYSLIGSDEAVVKAIMRSETKRDPRVRKAVIIRAGGSCERLGCGVKRDFIGFLDVHHILGVEKSDRYWNCVALCPNCHREAHAAPNRDEINAALLEYAMEYTEQTVRSNND